MNIKILKIVDMLHDTFLSLVNLGYIIQYLLQTPDVLTKIGNIVLTYQKIKIFIRIKFKKSGF